MYIAEVRQQTPQTQPYPLRPCCPPIRCQKLTGSTCCDPVVTKSQPPCFSLTTLQLHGVRTLPSSGPFENRSPMLSIGRKVLSPTLWGLSSEVHGTVHTLNSLLIKKSPGGQYLSVSPSWTRLLSFSFLRSKNKPVQPCSCPAESPDGVSGWSQGSDHRPSQIPHPRGVTIPTTTQLERES